MFKAIGMVVTFCFLGFVGLVIMSPEFQESFKQGYEAGNLVGKGQKVSYGTFNVYYDGISKELAEKAKDNLVDFMSVKPDDSQRDIFLIKEGNVIQIKVPVRTGIVIDQKTRTSMGYMAYKLSNEVFNGEKTETHMCDMNLVTQEIALPVSELGVVSNILLN